MLSALFDRLSRIALPKTATAPFCPAEVRGAVPVPDGLPTWKRMLRTAGPGLLVSVGYMDPGNWATDIEAGSRYGTSLLFVVVLSSLAAILLQTLSMRLGLVTGKDLARMSRERYGPWTVKVQWALAELAIIACDIAEVLGSALAFKLLLGVPLWAGVLLTGLDTIIVLGLKGKGFRQLEAIILGLISTVGICFLVQLIIVPPDAGAVARGLVPSLAALQQGNALYLAIGILGATIMPHNLYLHSSIVQTRLTPEDVPGKRAAIRLATIDTVVALVLALFVNAAILVLAASAFHGNGLREVAGIEEAHELLAPITGAAVAGILFGIALFASGQSATFTGTIAGQVILEGFLNLSIPCWQRRLITRGLAIVPALAGVLTLGDHAVGRLLVLTQVVLSAQLPFAIWPLLRFTDDKALMDPFANGPVTRLVAWGLFVVISAANVWLVVSTFS
ncbi:divalent metal cation transporter [Caulobacter radicis]|uniref:Nramp family divalent metal transporter n=1 Tax=Caulobacter radicis TaxID=2172650 RepID=UPI000D5771CD|nr:Nramp family divalent metal transporter [Caulobacter radicis]PVM90273.1 divalent metal cation transporter [Caulobacter radicis]